MSLWKDLGFDRALNRALRSGKRSIDVEALVRAMVFNRLCDAKSKLGCLRWLETVAMPAMPETVTHQHLLRAMDALMDNAEAEQSYARRKRINELEAMGNTMVTKLDAQDQGKSAKGRRASDRGAYSRFVRAIADAELARFIKADFTADRFSWEVDEEAITRAALFKAFRL